MNFHTLWENGLESTLIDLSGEDSRMCYCFTQGLGGFSLLFCLYRFGLLRVTLCVCAYVCVRVCTCVYVCAHVHRPVWTV